MATATPSTGLPKKKQKIENHQAAATAIIPETKPAIDENLKVTYFELDNEPETVDGGRVKRPCYLLFIDDKNFPGNLQSRQQLARMCNRIISTKNDDKFPHRMFVHAHTITHYMWHLDLVLNYYDPECKRRNQFFPTKTDDRDGTLLPPLRCGLFKRYYD